MTSFEGKDLTVCEKVAGTWLANAPWRKQNDGTDNMRQKADNV